VGERALAGGSQVDRETALAEAGRAIALDASNAEALAIMMRLVTEPPRELPAEARAEIEKAHDQKARVSAGTASKAYLTWLVFTPFVLAMGVKDLLWSFGASACWVIASIVCYYVFRTEPFRRWILFVSMGLVAVGTAQSSGMFGPFVVVPTLAVAVTTAHVLAMPRGHRWIAMVLGCASILVPFALQLAGVVPGSYVFDHGTMTILPHALGLPAGPTLTLLALANIGLVLTPAFFVSRLRNELDAAEERLVVQSWQLRHLVPKEARGGMSAPPAPSQAECPLS
jgi:serine/threonine-protein kinase